MLLQSLAQLRINSHRTLTSLPIVNPTLYFQRAAFIDISSWIYISRVVIILFNTMCPKLVPSPHNSNIIKIIHGRRTEKEKFRIDWPDETTRSERLMENFVTFFFPLNLFASPNIPRDFQQWCANTHAWTHRG